MTLPVFSRPVDPQSPLAEFVDRDYAQILATRARASSAQFRQRRKQRLAELVKLLSAFLRRPAIVADVTEPNIAGFVAWHARIVGHHASIAKMRRELQSLGKAVRRVTDGRRINGRRKRVCSIEPGTLWGICLIEYFPRNLKIRSEKTRQQYRFALCDFQDALGREPTLADLTDDNVILMMTALHDRGLTPKAVNERRGRLVSLWNWLAKRRRVEMFPTVDKLPEPRRIPRAWEAAELTRLFAACLQEEGELLPGIAAADFWFGLHWALWDTGERIGALLACRWEWLDWATGFLAVDADVRKGKDTDFLHKLRPESLAVLARMRGAGYELIFPWPMTEVTFYKRYNRILGRAGLPTSRKDKFHKMRRSVASHLQAMGVDACTALGHSSSDVTRKSYLDPRIVVKSKPCDLLFSPTPAAELLGPPAKDLPRLAYRPREPDAA